MRLRSREWRGERVREKEGLVVTEMDKIWTLNGDGGSV